MQVIISLGEGRTWNQGGSAEMEHYLLTCFHIIFVSRSISQPASHWRWLRVNVMYLNVNKQQVLFSTRCVCVNTLEQEACRSPHLAKNNEKSRREKPCRPHSGMREGKIVWMLFYLLLSRSGSLPFRHDTTPQGDILGLHSMSASPPTFTSVWLLSWLWEKSGATAETRAAR